jgi:hypothetical protein
MIKFILIAILSFALSGTVIAHDEELEILQQQEDDLKQDELNAFDPECQIAGSVKVKLSVKVPPGGCGCPEDEDESTDNCLGIENSKKISDAVIDILHANGDSYDVISALQIPAFLSGGEYNSFADNIKQNDYEFEGFADLKELVETYKICKKECKVYFTLRKALRENAADAAMNEENQDDGTKTLTIAGPVVVLSDIVVEVQSKLMRDIQITNVVFDTPTFFADSNLPNTYWHGKKLTIRATNFVITTSTVAWDLHAFGEESDGSIVISGVQNWDKGSDGTNTLLTFPDFTEE